MARTTWIDRGLLLQRVALGMVFIMHGWQKVFVYGYSAVAGNLGQLGLPFPSVSAFLISATELLGGLAVLLGFGTRVAAALLAFAMAVAVVTVHLPHGFFAPMGFEYPFTLMLFNVSMVLMGAGAYSVDAQLFGKREEQRSFDWRHAA